MPTADEPVVYHDPSCSCSWRAPDLWLAEDMWVACMCGGSGCVHCRGKLLPPAECDREVTVSPAYAWTTFYRSGNFLPQWPTAVRFEADRELSTEDVEDLVCLIGYHYRAVVHGDPLGDPVVDSRRSFVLSADVATSTSKHLSAALRAFEDGLAEVVRDGSPVRLTDRAGPGTKGTRLLLGMGEAAPSLDVYYDQVEDDETSLWWTRPLASQGAETPPPPHM